MEVCWGTQVADVGSAQRWRKSFSLVAEEWVQSLTEEEFSFTVYYQYHSTEIKHFLETIILSYKKNLVPQTFSGCMVTCLSVGTPKQVERKQKFLCRSPGRCRHTEWVFFQSSIRLTGMGLELKLSPDYFIVFFDPHVRLHSS